MVLDLHANVAAIGLAVHDEMYATKWIATHAPILRDEVAVRLVVDSARFELLAAEAFPAVHAVRALGIDEWIADETLEPRWAVGRG